MSLIARGNHCVVFANLITKGENHGLHAFIVPVRDSQGKVLPGVKLEDLGNKLYVSFQLNLGLANIAMVIGV